MTDISLILFDLNGVLSRYDRDARISLLASITNRTSDTVTNAIWTSGFEDSGDAGALDAAAYLRGFGAALGGTLSEADWIAAQQVALTPIAATLTLLPHIRPGVRTAVLTNNNLLLLRHFQPCIQRSPSWWAIERACRQSSASASRIRIAIAVACGGWASRPRRRCSWMTARPMSWAPAKPGCKGLITPIQQPWGGSCEAAASLCDRQPF